MTNSQLTVLLNHPKWANDPTIYIVEELVVVEFIGIIRGVIKYKEREEEYHLSIIFLWIRFTFNIISCPFAFEKDQKRKIVFCNDMW